MSVLDCSIGEGGGSIVRIASALAAATNSPLKLINIRSNRPNPGLRSQHLEAINALRQFSGFEVVGADLGSKELSLDNFGAKKNEATVRIGTAGSISLVAQAVQYYALNNRNQLTLNIQGGATHGKWAPSVEFVKNVTFKILEKMKKVINIEIDYHGFYPKGGARSRFIFKSHDQILPLNLTERGILEEISVFSTVSSHLRKRNVAERQLETFAKLSKQTEKITPHISYVNSNSPGTGLTIVNTYSSGAVKGCFIPGERSITAEQVGEMCWKKWKDMEVSIAAVDAFAADQLIVAMALAKGNSAITVDKLTNHTKTNIDLIQKFIPVTINVMKKNGFYSIAVKQF